MSNKWAATGHNLINGAGEIARTLRCVALFAILPLLISCSNQPKVPFSYTIEPLSFEPGNQYNITDGRARFREIFCAANEDHGALLPDFRSCEEALVRFDDEPAATGTPVELGTSSLNLLAKMVPGLGYSCVKPWLDHDNSAPRHVAEFGYDAGFIQVEGIASSDTNGELIAQSVQSLSRNDDSKPLVLVGYSKGLPDIFSFLTNHPDLARQVTAVVSYSGAVWGSALAEGANEKQLRWLTRVPGAECEKKDSKALETLMPANRKQWFATQTLPEHIRYYSVVSFPDPDNIPNGLKGSHRKLGQLRDARNDSQLVFYDQIIPGSTLLGFFNADHWAMSIPIARQHRLSQALFADKNDFPREIALEAILRFVEEDLLTRNDVSTVP